MRLCYCSSALLISAFLASGVAGFDVLRDYSGENFFDGWEFYGYIDNLTWGNVTWVDQATAFQQQLAYINDAGNAILKVDNFTNVTVGQPRNSIRMTSNDLYDYGSVWIIDLVHLPFGCSVWPAFWSKGPLWPEDGEIDIIEAINVMPNNQMALHTTSNCTHGAVAQTGSNIDLDCATGSGCTVKENAPNSYESGFAAAGGGVWATQFDYSGIYIWFWSRPDIPSSITNATATSSIDISEWGVPSASYPITPQCNITELFTAQQLILDITLCGDWAGVPSIYDSTCAGAGPTGSCYFDNVPGPGSPKYDDAYFEISYIRTYTTGGSAPLSTSSPSIPTFLSHPSASTADPPPKSSASSTSAHLGGGLVLASVLSWLVIILLW